MHVRIRIERQGRTIAAASEDGVGRETYVSLPGVTRLQSIRDALDEMVPARAAGAAVDSICREARNRHMSWRGREDEPMLRDEIRIHWAPGATRQWREDERWLPEGSTTLVLEIMTDAAAALDVPMAA